jgi:two-component system, NtrC family, response regulator
MAEGLFREDLYYRLAVVVVQLPALRNRNGDVQLLAREFLRRFASTTGKENLVFGADALRAVERHSWPGNVRELENRIQRAVIMADGRMVTAEDLQLSSQSRPVAGTTLKEAREAVERALVVEVLAKHGGRISPAAVELGISRPTLYELMEKLGIEKPPKEKIAE